MGSEALERQLDEPLVKAFAGPRRENLTKEPSGQPERDQSLRDIDPVRPSKWLNEPVRITPIPGDLVVLENHPSDLRRPFRSARVDEVSTRQSDRWLQIVKCAVCPYAQVVKGGGDGDLLDLLGVARGESDAQVHDTVRVISVRREVASQLYRMGMQQLIESGDLREQYPSPAQTAERCLSIQPLMSAITASLSKSLSKS